MLLFRRKMPVADDPGPQLLRVLTAWDLTLLGIGAMTGTGIFILAGHAAAGQAGPGVMLSFVVAGFACAFAALAYAEMAASVGGCGGAYGYAYAAFGEFIAWLIGWGLLLEYGLAAALVANSWAGYFNSIMSASGYGLPEALTKGPLATKMVMLGGKLTQVPDPGLVSVYAMLLMLVLMGVLASGVRAGVRLNALLVMIKLAVIGVFVIVAVRHIDTKLWEPFMPFGWLGTGADGAPVGILAGASAVFLAFVGFDAVSTAVEEAKNPQRDLPTGILGSLAFCIIVYIIFSGLLTALVPYRELVADNPFAYALGKTGFRWGTAVVAAGTVTGLATVALVLYYGLTRILLAMSRDGLLPGFFGKISAGTRVPTASTVACGAIIAVLAGLLPQEMLMELVQMGTLVAFVTVCLGVIVLRFTQPELKRPFRIPGSIVIPALGAFSCGGLISFIPAETQLRFVLWLGVGIVVYFSYAMRHSKLAARPLKTVKPRK